MDPGKGTTAFFLIHFFLILAKLPIECELVPLCSRLGPGGCVSRTASGLAWKPLRAWVTSTRTSKVSPTLTPVIDRANRY